jgi:hypothetical protein
MELALLLVDLDPKSDLAEFLLKLLMVVLNVLDPLVNLEPVTLLIAQSTAKVNLMNGLIAHA